MILKKEIQKKAIVYGVSRSTVDKDWVLGHFIDAIFSIPECREKLIFKGGILENVILKLSFLRRSRSRIVGYTSKSIN